MIRRLALALALAGCARLTPPTLPAERLEVDRLSRARAAGEALSPRDQRRLAVLIDRYDNAPDRADLIDGELDDPRARQARAWRGWARLVPGWATRLTDAIVADPGDPGAAALAGLLPAKLDGGLRARLEAVEGLHPVARCRIDPACPAAEAEARRALEALAAIDPVLDPEADRLRWTLATFGPAPTRSRPPPPPRAGWRAGRATPTPGRWPARARRPTIGRRPPSGWRGPARRGTGR